MSRKYPVKGHPRPYVIDPFDEDPPLNWFTGDEYYAQHCVSSYFEALIRHIAAMPVRVLHREFENACDAEDDVDYTIPCQLTVDTDIYYMMLEGEMHYRQQVDNERQQKQKKLGTKA